MFVHEGVCLIDSLFVCLYLCLNERLNSIAAVAILIGLRMGSRRRRHHATEQGYPPRRIRFQILGIRLDHLCNAEDAFFPAMRSNHLDA